MVPAPLPEAEKLTQTNEVAPTTRTRESTTVTVEPNTERTTTTDPEGSGFPNRSSIW